MSTSATANRIYARERIVAEDITEMGPDELLVSGCKPPTQTAGGLYTPEAGAVGEIRDENRAHPIRACALFRIEKMPPEENMTKGNPLGLEVGDVVLCRNALVDPLLGNELALTNMYLGVVAVAERAA